MNKREYSRLIRWFFNKNYNKLFNQCKKLLELNIALQSVSPPLEPIDVLDDYWYWVEQSSFLFQDNLENIKKGMFYPQFIFYMKTKYRNKGDKDLFVFRPENLILGYPEPIVYLASAELPKYVAKAVLLTKYFNTLEIKEILGIQSMQGIYNYFYKFRNYMKEHYDELAKIYNELKKKRLIE